MKGLIQIPCLALIILNLSEAYARTIHVSPDGADTASGTLPSPLRTIQKAAEVARAGDTVLVRAGVYKGLVLLRFSGEPDKPILFKNAPGERPVVDGEGRGRIELQSEKGWQKPIGWIAIEGFEVRNGWDGIKFYNAHHIVLKDNFIHHNANQGILGNGHHVRIEGNVIAHNGLKPGNEKSNKEHGIYATGTDFEIVKNVIHSNRAYGIQVAAYPFKPESHAGPEFASARRWHISHNTFAFQQYRAGIVIWQEEATDCVIEKNIFYRNAVTLGRGDCQGIDFVSSGGGHVLRDNLFYGPGRTSIPRLPANCVATNNLEGTDPRFVDTDRFDFRLQPSSPAIGLGARPAVSNDGSSLKSGEFFVSPYGNDAWTGQSSNPGATNGPFATLERARDAIRALRQTQKTPIPVRVTIRGGLYFLDRTVEFGSQDSGTEAAPVVYAAAPGEKVVLSGGRCLENGQWGEVNGRKAWMVGIPEVKTGAWRFRQLFVNGDRRPRTRLPKQGEYRIESLPGYTGDFLRSPTKQFVYAPGHIRPTWRNLRDVEVVGLTRWLDNRLPIESVNGETRTVTFDRPSLFALLSGSQPGPYWVENVFEALDTPGQWYLDRPGGMLYYLPRPGEEMFSVEMIAPRLTQVVRVVGRADAPVHDIHFEGLVFAHTEWQPPADYASSLQAGIEVPGALYFDYAERCSVRDGAIEHIGNYGIEVNVGCADIEIARNRITDIGAGGIRIGHFFSWETDGSGRLTERGLQRKASMPQGPRSQRITVADNEIAYCGRFTPEAVGVFVGDNANNQIVRNHIHDLFYSGISVGSVQDFGPHQATNNLIESNHVHDIGQGVLSDLAGIYTCSTPNSRIAYNVVHDIARRDYGGWGIYTDEGSHELLIRNNLVYRCQDGALFVHHSRSITAENNILAFNHNAQVDRGGIGGLELIFQRNLVCYQEGKAIGSYGIANSARDVCAFDRNLYWNASGQPVLFGNQSISEWQATGQDKNSLIANPEFVDPQNGDFRLRPGSPAHKIGFEPWDISTVGPRRNLQAPTAMRTN